MIPGLGLVSLTVEVQSVEHQVNRQSQSEQTSVLLVVCSKSLSNQE